VADDYESRLKLHILPKLGHLRLDEVRSAEWERERDEITRQIAAHDKAKTNYLTAGVKLLELAQVAYKLYAGTAPDRKGHSAENRDLAATADGQDRTGLDSECQSVSGVAAPDRRSEPPCYCNGMSTLHARVKGGQIVVEGKTDLPEGTELTLVMVESDDEMTPEERADLEAELERGRAAIAAGKGISGDELLARVRET
jgi:hypothetical protein